MKNKLRGVDTDNKVYSIMTRGIIDDLKTSQDGLRSSWYWLIGLLGNLNSKRLGVFGEEKTLL